ADLESQLKGVMSRESSVNTENLAVLLSVIAIITSGAVVYHGFFVLGGALAVAAGLAFFGRRYLAKESPEDRIHRQIQGVVSEREKAEEEFKGYIRDELNLHDLLTPDSLLEIFRLIDEIKREIEQRDRLKSRLETERIPFIKRFEEEAEFLKPFLSDSGSSPEMMWVVSEIFREYDYALQKKSEAEELSYELQRRKRELASVDQRLKEVDGSVNELLRSVSAEDMDDFIRKYKENQRAAELKRQRRDDLRTIQRIVGINKSEEIIGYLASRDKEDMEAELQGLQKDIGSKEEEYRDRVNRLGETRNEIERIAGTSDLSEVLTEYETEKQRLRQAYLEWVAGNTALKVLSEVRQRYEIEKQPEVVKNTAGFFREITEGRYKKVTASLESEEVSIIDDKSISKGIEELSRGTKEQLLISLRLGFILEYERQGTSLPVIADEILVNFDERRAEVTAGILRDFAEQRQLLMFTCHTATKDFFSPEDVNLITL
ncbi:MAG: ATP-binding protein, partial [Chitinivibrionales bacterium]